MQILVITILPIEEIISFVILIKGRKLAKQKSLDKLYKTIEKLPQFY